MRLVRAIGRLLGLDPQYWVARALRRQDPSRDAADREKLAALMETGLS